MTELSLLCPVHTIDNELLLPKGAVLSSSTMDTLLSSRKGVSPRKLSLLQHGTVKKDIRDLLGQPPYSVIFPDKGKISALLELMKEARFPPQFLQSTDYFYQNDFYTYRHILMVFALSVLIAGDLISDRKKLIQQISVGPTHDIGKVCIPLHILKKTTPLSRNEREILRQHSAAGYVLLSHYLHDKQSLAAKVARDHHERRDASGYLRGIHLNNSMIEVIAACDVYDALISARPYRSGSYDNRTALEEITRMAEESRISWNIVKALVAHYRKEKSHYSMIRISKVKRGTSPAGNLYGMTEEDLNSAAGTPGE
jgi:HD-GYP domain-containing protein (c-di-GMP phosphodiesterase class II)